MGVEEVSPAAGLTSTISNGSFTTPPRSSGSRPSPTWGTTSRRSTTPAMPGPPPRPPPRPQRQRGSWASGGPWEGPAGRLGKQSKKVPCLWWRLPTPLRFWSLPRRKALGRVEDLKRHGARLRSTGSKSKRAVSCELVGEGGEGKGLFSLQGLLGGTKRPSASKPRAPPSQDGVAGGRCVDSNKGPWLA